MFRVSDDNIAAHRNDRKIRAFDETNTIQVCVLRTAALESFCILIEFTFDQLDLRPSVI